MRPKIIILQSSYHGFMLCCEELGKIGLQVDTDFSIFNDESGIHDQWEPGQRQLFITGTFSGSEEGIAEMVQKARECNSELVCMSFSVEPIDCPFDHVIEKNRENFVAAVLGFLNGTLNRTCV